MEAQVAENFYQQTVESPKSAFDLSLRPPLFSEFQGQTRVRERLELMVEAAKQRGDVLEHVLLSGPPGLGKTTLAYILANSMGVNIKSTSGPMIERAGDLAGILTTLERGDILFIDEIHRLQPAIEEYLYPAMEDFRLDIIIDQGPNARSVRLNLPKFTLIGATTRSGLISAPLRSRFGMTSRLDYYGLGELSQIVQRSAGLIGVGIDSSGCEEIASRSRGTPRVANNLLRQTVLSPVRLRIEALKCWISTGMAWTRWISGSWKLSSFGSRADRWASIPFLSPLAKIREPSKRSMSLI
jgi:holliday junction DNA helicase RuvB